MQLKILTPERIVLEDEADAVYARSTDGEFGVLPGHIPMVSPLAISTFYYFKNGNKQFAAVMGGLLSTDGKSVTILCDAAELGPEIDKVRAQQAKEKAEARLHQRLDGVDVQQAEMALQRALVRLKTATSGNK